MIGKETRYSLPLLISLPHEQESIHVLREELDLDDAEFELACQLFNKGLPPLTNPKCLPYLFGISHQLIGYMEKFPNKFYRLYEVPKVGGGTRNIEAPRRFLKIIQSWINQHICCKGNVPEFVNGFVKGRSIFSNGAVHAGKGNLMVVDIEDFFPSVRFEQVERVFRDFGFRTRVVHQLAALCCLDRRLPQGAPTSPALANLVFKPLDEKIFSLAQDWGTNYSRYADDLAFSGSMRFNEAHVSQVRSILEEGGFSINSKKTRIIGRGGRQMLAGLVVNEKNLPARVVRRNWRATFHRAKNHPEKYSNRVANLYGIAAFVNQYSPETAAAYRHVARSAQDASRG